MGNNRSFMLQDEEVKLISDETGFSPAQVERLYSRFITLDKEGKGSLSRQDCLAIPELAINPLCDRIVQMFFNECDEDHERINFRQFMKVLATFRPSNHKSSPLSRSRNHSRQESLNQQQQQSILDKGHLLFDSIDASSFSNAPRMSRHSSYLDATNSQHQHRTTNQHSIHYAASSNHLPPNSNNHHHHHHHHHHHSSFRGQHSDESDGSQSLIDPDEPLNSAKQKLHFMFKFYDVDDDNRISLSDIRRILHTMVGNYISEEKLNDLAENALKKVDKNCTGYIEFDEFCAEFFHKGIDQLIATTI